MCLSRHLIYYGVNSIILYKLLYYSIDLFVLKEIKICLGFNAIVLKMINKSVVYFDPVTGVSHVVHMLKLYISFLSSLK